MDKIGQLIELLNRMQTSALDGDPDLIAMVAESWDGFALQGYDDGGMTANKLYRVCDLSWDPPHLSFRIERHGGAVAGNSKIGEIQAWSLDLDKNTKSWSPGGYRLLRPREPRVDAGSLAKEICEKIVSRHPHRALKYLPAGEVKVSTPQIPGLGRTGANGLPLAKQTVGGRRRRFMRKLEELLSAQGWKKVRPGVFVPASP